MQCVCACVRACVGECVCECVCVRVCLNHYDTMYDLPIFNVYNNSTQRACVVNLQLNNTTTLKRFEP